MKTIKYSILILIAILPLTSCEDIVQFKGAEAEAKMVLNAVIDCTGKNYSFDLSRTAFIYSQENIRPVYDANIQISVNDEIIAEGGWLPGSSHGTSYFPTLNANDKVSVRIEHDELGVITAEDKIPHKPEIISLETVRNHDESTRVFIKIKDDPSTQNFYRLRLIEVHDNYETDAYFDIKQDPALSSINSSSGEGINEEEQNRSRIFPDDLFDGGEYTIDISFYSGYDRQQYRVELQSMTKALYLYMRTLEQYWDNDDILHEPVKLYSNIKGGYGILGLYNPSSIMFSTYRPDTDW